jgi:N-acetylglutamate synthase-like GNAT family acetyltransferase
MIRVAEERDFDGIMDLLKQLNPRDPAIADGRDKVIFNMILQQPNLRIIVMEEKGKTISTCYLNIIPNLTRNASPYAVLENVVTDAAFRKQGFGKQTIQFALDYAWKAGCYKVMLLTGRDNTHDFYKSCGFKAGEKFAFLAKPPKTSQ